MKLTQPQIKILVHARAQGSVYPEPCRGAGWSRAGGAIHRTVERLARDGLVGRQPPFEITDKGREAVEQYDDFGFKKSRMTPEALAAVMK